jgi:hypothetical protein
VAVVLTRRIICQAPIDLLDVFAYLRVRPSSSFTSAGHS